MIKKIATKIRVYNKMLPIYLLIRGPWAQFLPDELFLKLRFRLAHNRKLDLENPKSFSEKLQWMKLYDRDPYYSLLVDKFEVKAIVSKIIGEQYIIPTLGIWNSFEEIDFDTLPNQFVLKCTHDSGGIVICKDKHSFDINSARQTINRCLKQNYYLTGREWPYKNVKPRILAEEYCEDKTFGELRDYKFFTFDGKVKAMFVASERQNTDEETKFDFFDRDYNHLNVLNGHPNAKKCPEKPLKYNEMITLAEKISKGFKHLRVDFYEVNGKVYFGEITFTHNSGMVPFDPVSWDYWLGSWLKLKN